MKAKRILAICMAGFLACSDCSAALAAQEWKPDLAKPEQMDSFGAGRATSSNAEKATPSDAVLEGGQKKGEETRFHYQTTVNQVTVTVEAEPGVLPSGTLVKVKPIEEEDGASVLSIVENSGIYEEKTVLKVMAFDISLWYEHEEIEPEQGTVTVTFRTEALEEEESLESSVFHIEDETQEVTYVDHEKDAPDKITFEADSFSVYGIALLAKDSSYWDVVKNAEIYKASGGGISSGQLKDQAGKINVLLFGRMERCINTMQAAKMLETLLTAEAAEKVNVYLLDVDSTWDSVVKANANLDPAWNYVTVCGDPGNQTMNGQGCYEGYMWSLLNKDRIMENVQFPVIYIFDSNQEKMYSHTGIVTQGELAEALLQMDGELSLSSYVSTEDILQVNRESYDKNREDREALQYYRFYEKNKFNHLPVYNRAVEITKNCTSDEARVKAIHDWVAESVYYDYDSFRRGFTGETEPSRILAMSPMRSVCQGYANLTEELCRAVGIPCKTVSGYALGVGGEPYWTSDILNGNEMNHAWNEVYINGKWTVLDTTWDSQNRYENGQAVKKEKRDKYYNISLEEFSEDHKIVEEEAFGVPPVVTGLKVTDNIGTIKLSWETEENWFEDFGGCKFIVYRKAGLEEYRNIGTTYSLEYTDDKASAGISYTYKVTARASNGYETEGMELPTAVELLNAHITISEREALYVGQVKKLDVTYHDFAGQTPAVTWESSDPSVVKVDADGSITGVGPGHTSIRARVNSGRWERCYITVEDLYEVSNPRVTDNYAGFIRLEWDSQTKGSAIERKETGTDLYEELSIHAEGTYTDTAVESGHTYVYHIYNKGREQNTPGITVEVKVNSAKIVLPQELAMAAGNSLKLDVRYENFDTQLPAVTYDSSDPDVVTVDQDGTVKAVAEGKADITLSVNNSRYQVSTEIYCAAKDYRNCYTPYEKSVIEIVNKERLARDRVPLSALIKMQRAADVRSVELRTSFSHTRPDGSSCFTALHDAGVDYHAAGENIAYGYGSPPSVMYGWMNSTGHRNNILDSTFRYIGVGETDDRWVQQFIGGGKEHYAMLLPDNLEVSRGTAVNNLGITILTYSEQYGIGYLPLTAEMVSGYQPDSVGTQTVAVEFSDYDGSFTVTVKGSGGGGSGSGGGGGGSSSGGGGGGGSSSGGGGGGGSSSGGGGGGGSSFGGGGGAVGPGAGAGNLGNAASIATVQNITPSTEYVMEGNWQADGQRWRLLKKDGSYAANQWSNLNNRWYLIGSDSYMLNDWQLVNNVWYYLNSDGSMATGWALVRERWYYLNESGAMLTGDIVVDGKTWHLGADGAWIQ